MMSTLKHTRHVKHNADSHYIPHEVEEKIGLNMLGWTPDPSDFGLTVSRRMPVESLTSTEQITVHSQRSKYDDMRV